MIHHLASFGWPYLLLCALVAAAAGRSFGVLLVRWARFEMRLARRARARGGFITPASPRRHW